MTKNNDGPVTWTVGICSSANATVVATAETPAPKATG